MKTLQGLVEECKMCILRFPSAWDFLLDGCMLQSYQILRRGYLYSGYLSIYLSIFLSFFLSFLSIYPSIHPSIDRSIYLSIYLSMAYSYYTCRLQIYIHLQLGKQRSSDMFIIDMYTHTHIYMYVLYCIVLQRSVLCCAVLY